jgi:colanic acid biosynthesis glycosyl transferase WcaI
MRILYLSQYFPPEAGATQTRAYEMARHFVRQGHQVTLIAEFPNHPSGIIPPRYRGRLFERENLEGIDVIRVWVRASPEKGFRSRMLFYLTYMLSATLAGLFLARRRCDLVFATSPPLFVGGAALALSWLRRIPLVFEVRDLWPEIAVALGELTNPRYIRWATALEEACYRRASRVVVVTQGTRQRLLERGLPPEKLLYIPNGANTDLFQFDPQARAERRAELGLGDRFVAIYAGIHGLAQGLETVLQAADRLRGEPRFHFLLLGEGPRKAELQALARSLDLTNLTFLPERPRHEIPAYLSAADAALIPLRSLDLFKVTLPSKLFDAWACELPLVLSVDGEARALLEAASGGLFTPPEDPAALADALRRLEQDRHAAREMGRRGRELTAARYSRQALAGELLEHLVQVARRG